MPAAPLDISIKPGDSKPFDYLSKGESNKQHQEKTFTCPQMSPSLTLPCADVEATTSLTNVIWDSSPPHGNKKSATHLSNACDCLEWESYLLESVRFSTNKEVEDDDARAETSNKLPSSCVLGEFYDAFDELSADSGTHSSSVNNIEIELRGMRLSLLMEIKRRRQAEETLEQMQLHWQRLREQLAHVGLFVPLDPTSSSQYSINIADELHCQLEVTRFVSESLGNNFAKAEVEMEMGSELEAKNFEITRLSDRLHYYETVNKEISQRNQEASEMARRDRQKRKGRQRWIWGSMAATITLGGAVLAWPYLPTAISSTDILQPQPSPIDEAP